MRLKPLNLTQILVLAILTAGPALAQSDGVKTKIERNAPGHTTIVIHDYSSQASERKNQQAEWAHQDRQAELQRQHEIELAKIEANAKVEASRPQALVTEAALAPEPVYNQKTIPSYRNGGQYTGATNNSYYYGGFNGFGYGYGAYVGYPINGYGYGYGYGQGYNAGYRPGDSGAGRVCAPAYRRCR